MSEEDLEIRTLSDDLALFISELAKIAALSPNQPEAVQACEKHFSDLPERVRSAIVYGHCTFIERRVEDRWQYLLQHGDFMVCDRIPDRMRNTILKPIVQYLTPLGTGSEIIWYCMS